MNENAITTPVKLHNVIGVCGYHNSGKTTLIVKIIEQLKKEGYEVATIKNIPRKFSIDEKGKDTWRHADAGAGAVVALSEDETAIIFKEGMELELVIKLLNETAKPDLIIVEGKKEEKGIPKIAIGDITVNGAFRYEENFEELIEWIKATLNSSSGRASPLH
ncbi:MAG: molybdopterin-guanine dinucleotide biosynthesis protein B [Candidatus Syntrophoarchaeum sp. GoM_oil]|nr:MAG: molybdopterin-guanine dinucleotide biosynthesis protein B [Candidatus Syntrophoarchaeum sp. GoM_oil]